MYTFRGDFKKGTSMILPKIQAKCKTLLLVLFAIFFPLIISTPSFSQLQPNELVTDPGTGEQAKVQEEFGNKFRILETKHFRIISDTSIRYHTVVAGILEQFHNLVQPRYFKQDIKKLNFYLINGGLDYELFMRKRELPNASGYGLYDKRTRSLYAHRFFPDGTESGVGTLFHETVHAMIDADFTTTAPPTWFHEGFASLFEAGRILQGQWVYGNPNPWRETPFRAAFEQGQIPSLKTFLATPDRDFDAPKPQRDLLYNTGRSLFLYILRNHGEPTLVDFVRHLRNGLPPEKALSTSTRLKLTEIERKWHKSIHQLNFGGDYLNRGKGANAFSILKEGAQKYPDYGNLQLSLAIEYLNQENYPTALKHAQQALKDPHLLFRQQAHYVVARGIISTDANTAAHNLQKAIAFQPWNEQIFVQDYNLLIFMLEKIGQSSQAIHFRSELKKMQKLDQR
jgi:hypothetical protein